MNKVDISNILDTMKLLCNKMVKSGIPTYIMKMSNGGVMEVLYLAIVFSVIAVLVALRKRSEERRVGKEC